MALNYTNLFAMLRLYCRADQKLAGHDTDVDTLILHQITSVDSLNDVDYYQYLNDLLATDKSWLSNISSFRAQIKRRCDTFLTGEGKNVAQSTNTVAASIVSDISTFMTRDSQTVKQNTLGNSIAYSRSGNGTVSTITQNQFTRNDVITLTCITAQDADTDAVFSVRSDYWGALTATVTADGTTSYDDADLGEHLGLTALVVDPGTPGPSVMQWWDVSDQITITTTSTDAGIILSAIRDMYDVLLPSAGSPTIAD
jgi:hypothetical protein